MRGTAAASASSPSPAAPLDLRARLARRIAQDGPMTVAEFMAACLYDPHAGYYATRPALGAEGDFVTAPLVSQMFGELVGAWLAEMWGQMGRPDPVRLVEFGPGDGTLMSDVLRVLAGVPGLHDALDLWLAEPSAPLRAVQARRLADAAPRFAGGLEQVPGGAPVLMVANEVFDCLAARQFVRGPQGWSERRIGLDADGALVFGLAPLPSGAEADLPADARPGEVVERSAAQTALAAAIAHRVGRDGGAALILDYGGDDGGRGDTLQALRGHRKLAPLEAPGEADLTVHVDFGAVAAAARAEGAAVSPLAAQGEFLRALGIVQRAERLSVARPDLAETVHRQLARLTAPGQMGELFKALCIHSPGLTPPGFPDLDPVDGR